MNAQTFGAMDALKSKATEKGLTLTTCYFTRSGINFTFGADKRASVFEFCKALEQSADLSFVAFKIRVGYAKPRCASAKPYSVLLSFGDLGATELDTLVNGLSNALFAHGNSAEGKGASQGDGTFLTAVDAVLSYDEGQYFKVWVEKDFHASHILNIGRNFGDDEVMIEESVSLRADCAESQKFVCNFFQ